MSPQAFVFFGRSGCGKGTQANQLIQFLKSQNREVAYVETGSRFREFMQSDNFSSKLIRDTLSSGGLLPVFLPIWMWTDFLVKNFSGKQDLIFDGVCRRLEESVVLDSAFDFYKIEKPNIILINTSNDWSHARMMERKRHDDTKEEIQKRFDWYEKDVLPAIAYFQDNPKFNFIEINGEQSIEAVHKDILNALSLS